MILYVIGGIAIVATIACLSVNWARHMKFENRHDIEIGRHDAEHQAIVFAHDNLDRQVDDKMATLMETVNTEPKKKRKKKEETDENSGTKFLRAVVESKVDSIRKSSKSKAQPR